MGMSHAKVYDMYINMFSERESVCMQNVCVGCRITRVSVSVSVSERVCE